MENKEIQKRTKTTTRVSNRFNQDSSAEKIAIKKFIKEADLDIMLIGQHGYREVRQAFYQNSGPVSIRMCEEKANVKVKIMCLIFPKLKASN